MKQSGLAHGIVMWWTLDMDVDGDITLTTAPRWAHPDGADRQVQHLITYSAIYKVPVFIESAALNRTHE